MKINSTQDTILVVPLLSGVVQKTVVATVPPEPEIDVVCTFVSKISSNNSSSTLAIWRIKIGRSNN